MKYEHIDKEKLIAIIKAIANDGQPLNAVNQGEYDEKDERQWMTN